ncbi:MAG: methyl-accepting chemotaxis protein, partial [Burkholderiaceae bacterium]
NQAIGQMDQVTQQNAALVEEASAAAESMQEQAGKLAQVVAVFQLDRGHGAQPAAVAATATATATAATEAATAAAKPATSKPASKLASKATGKAGSAVAVPRVAQPAQPIQPLQPAATAGGDWEEF